jgi:hypothetical protein
MRIAKKTKVTPAMREKFFNDEGYMVDDATILRWWNTKAYLQEMKSNVAKPLKSWKPSEDKES